MAIGYPRYRQHRSEQHNQPCSIKIPESLQKKGYSSKYSKKLFLKEFCLQIKFCQKFLCDATAAQGTSFEPGQPTLRLYKPTYAS